MSTRRARIKAVTSLPPRRKNNDGAGNKKIVEKDIETLVKSPQTREGGDNTKTKIPDIDVEKPIKSPRTRRSPIKTPDNLNKVSPKVSQPLLTSPLTSPHSVNTIFSKQTDRVPSPAAPKDITRNAAVTPKRSEKVSVITSIFTVKPNVFVSPKGFGSPLRKPSVSPQIQNSKVEINVQRLTPIMPKEKEVERNMGDIDKNDGKAKDNSQDLPTSTTKNIASDTIKSDVVQTEPSRSDVPDDYSVPSVPESVTEDAVMDGIVPLQAISSAPKPLALLKNEIISENAEVLFDPIVPLPSPSKVRPKLRPVPRLAPLRRNSVQGSASESEDENRRALLSGGSNTPALQRQRHDSHTSHSTMHTLPNREVVRIRNDSMCSSASHITTQPPPPLSPVKDKHLTKSRRMDMARRMTAMRRRRETVKRDNLTMYDLIFYNPSSNPIIPDQDELKAKEANEKEEAVRKATKETNEVAAKEPEQDAAPVPQIKLGPNGEIMLDEQSLVIKQSDNRQVSSDVIHEGTWGGMNTKGRYRRTPRTAEWSNAETVRFYRALAALGTDFMLMERLFPGRTRRDLKLKFKKEERNNMAQVDKALRTTSKWDALKLADEFQAEREAAEKQAKAETERIRQCARDERQRLKNARELKVRMSRGSKVLDTSSMPMEPHDNINEGLTANDIIRQHHEAKARKRKPKKPAPKTPQMTRIAPKPPTVQDTTSPFASLTRIGHTTGDKKISSITDMATLIKLDQTKSQSKTPDQRQAPTPSPIVPSNIENGSLVVLTVDDPNSPSKKMLQTYIASGGGRLTPVALPASFLNSVVTYMKKGTPKSNMSAGSSPHLTSPSSVASQDSRASSTPGVIQMNTSPAKRQRHSSYTITQL